MSYDSLMNAYDILLNASGILFGVLGLWVGIFYLEAVKNSTDPDKYEQAVKQSGDLLQPFFFSLLSFFITFFIVFLTPFLRIFELDEIWRICLKSIFAGCAAIIFCVLVMQVVVSMRQTGMFQDIVSQNAAVTDMKEHFMLGKRISNDKKNKH